MAIDSGNAIHVVWRDLVSWPLYAIYYSKSIDYGSTWSASQKLADAPEDGRVAAAIAIDSSDTIHVVWCSSTPGNYDLYYRRSADEGTSWTTARRLTWTSGRSTIPRVATVGNAIHVVWDDETPGHHEIYYKGSADGGVTWSAVRRLTWTSGHSYEPALAAGPDGTLHFIFVREKPWGGAEIFHKKSTDGGANWSLPKRLTWDIHHGSTHPAIAVDSAGHIRIVFNRYIYYEPTAQDYSEVYFETSSDGGANWSPAKRISWTKFNSSTPAVATGSNGGIHVVWSDYSPVADEIYYKKSLDDGLTWTPLASLSQLTDCALHPAIAVDSNNTIHVVYDTECVSEGIYFTRTLIALPWPQK
jgi:hypothetical protein